MTTGDVWALAAQARRTRCTGGPRCLHHATVTRLRDALGVVTFDEGDAPWHDTDRPDETKDPSAGTTPTPPSATPASAPTSGSPGAWTERPSGSAASGRGDADMAIGFSLSQQKLPPAVRKASKPGRGTTRGGLFGGRRAEPMVEITVRRRPAGSRMDSPLAERIYRNANPVQRVRVPLSQKGKARRDLGRAGWRIERERTVR